MDIPANFPYMKAFRAGRPVHNHDDFSKFIDRRLNAVQLSEDEKAELNSRLCKLAELTASSASAKENQPEISVEYYVPCNDPYHDAYGVGGTYETETGICWRVDDVFQTIMVGNAVIQFDDIRRIDGAIFEEDEL